MLPGKLTCRDGSDSCTLLSRSAISPAHLPDKTVPADTEPTAVILVVDDEPAVNRLVTRYLSHLGYRVLDANSAAEALDRVRRQEPRIDLVLCDVTMPEMDGWLAAEKLKADESTKSIPLYALTAHALPSERKRALEAGCDGYVSKPIHMAGFLEVIERALGRKHKKKLRNGREIHS